MVPPRRLSWAGRAEVAYWGEDGQNRIQLLEPAAVYMTTHRWGKVLDSGWLRWDLEVYCNSCLLLRVITAEEEHGGGRRLVRIRYRLTPTPTAWVACVVTLAGAVAVACIAPRLAVALGAAAATLTLCGWALGRRAAAHVLRLFDTIAQRLLMLDCSRATSEP